MKSLALAFVSPLRLIFTMTGFIGAVRALPIISSSFDCGIHPVPNTPNLASEGKLNLLTTALTEAVGLPP